MVNKESIRFQKSWWHSSSACSFNTRMVKCGGRRPVCCSCLLWFEESFWYQVWHEGLFVKLRAAGIEGAALRWLVSFLADRHQMTMVNGTMSTSAKLFAGVPKGAILSPLLFSIYMNDIPFPKSTNLFADDTSSFVTDSVPSLLESKLQERADSLQFWFTKWHLTVNPTKSAVMVFRSRKDAGRKHLHNSWLTPSTTGFTSPASWSHLLRHTGLDKPCRHHCKSSFGQS